MEFSYCGVTNYNGMMYLFHSSDSLASSFDHAFLTLMSLLIVVNNELNYLMIGCFE